jgi:hypothetical protein
MNRITGKTNTRRKEGRRVELGLESKPVHQRATADDAGAVVAGFFALQPLHGGKHG